MLWGTQDRAGGCGREDMNSVSSMLSVRLLGLSLQELSLDPQHQRDPGTKIPSLTKVPSGSPELSQLGSDVWTSMFVSSACPILAHILLSQFNQNPASSVSDPPLALTSPHPLPSPGDACLQQEPCWVRWARTPSPPLTPGVFSQKLSTH